MSLIQEIQDSLTAETTNLASILRKVKVLAYKLNEGTLKDWISKEINGYRERDVIPEYRKIHPRSLGYFVGAFNAQIKNCPIPTISLPDIVKKIAENTEITMSIHTLEELLNSEENIFAMMWDQNLVAYCNSNCQIIEGYSLVEAKKEVNRIHIEGVIDSVKNKLLDFILELQDKYPTISESDSEINKIPNEASKNIFHTYIYGNNAVVNNDSTINGNINIIVEKDDKETLRLYLLQNGIKQEEINSLITAIEEDNNSDVKHQGFGSKVTDWLYNASKMVGTGALANSIPTIIQGLMSFYG
ncbi:MAG TPA: hypothetical protein DF296_06295 [Candidatus Margulisbacteria bacterium]|nr:hypothetical protein [Candidatus Margulisiibacteriota bacterium]